MVRSWADDFRALKLWFAIRYFGADGLAARLRHHIEMAREFAELGGRERGFRATAPGSVQHGLLPRASGATWQMFGRRRQRCSKLIWTV